jgi:lysophospholipase L1-like esterase
VRLVVLTPPCHRPASLDARSQRRAEEARAAGVETLDLRALPAGACGTPRATDGIHFTAAGYRALAGQALAALAP